MDIVTVFAILSGAVLAFALIRSGIDG